MIIIGFVRTQNLQFQIHLIQKKKQKKVTEKKRKRSKTEPKKLLVITVLFPSKSTMSLLYARFPLQDCEFSDY
jgi:ATP adenylyltransferase/5',5'''-P-1,P-4-tetraphosphate phosphorylase II